MTFTIVRATNTCEAAPSQWDAWTDTGQYLYLRYRHGKGRAEMHLSNDWTTWSMVGVNVVARFRWCNCETYKGCHYTGVTGRPCYSGYITLEHFCELAGIELKL